MTQPVVAMRPLGSVEGMTGLSASAFAVAAGLLRPVPAVRSAVRG